MENKTVKHHGKELEIRKVGTSTGKELRDGIYESVQRSKYAAFDSGGNKIGAAIRTTESSFKILD